MIINQSGGSIDMSDATATAEDIIDGKIAYANGEQLIGTFVNGYNGYILKYNAKITNASPVDVTIDPAKDYFVVGYKDSYSYGCAFLYIRKGVLVIDYHAHETFTMVDYINGGLETDTSAYVTVFEMT